MKHHYWNLHHTQQVLSPEPYIYLQQRRHLERRCCQEHTIHHRAYCTLQMMAVPVVIKGLSLLLSEATIWTKGDTRATCENVETESILC
jgi:hypothetical protein